MRNFLLLGVFICGCADRTVLINHYYYSDGYVVKGLWGRWEHSEEKKWDRLITGEGFETRTYYDVDHDSVVDRVEQETQKYVRGQAGSEEIFKRADTDLLTARDRYDMPAIDKKWKEMKPDERAERMSYFK